MEKRTHYDFRALKKQIRHDPGIRIGRKNPKEIAKAYAKEGSDQPGFRVELIDAKIGLGVIVTKDFQQGDFLLEYAGKLLSGEKADTIEDTNYTYHFRYKGENKCIDATKELKRGPRFGRFVNHGDHPKDRNAVMKIIEVDNAPHLCLFSARKINIGEQILYDYGTKDLPWLKKTTARTSPIPTDVVQNNAETVGQTAVESIMLQENKDDSSGEASLYDDSNMDPDFKPDSKQSDSSHEAAPGSERETSDISPYPENKDDSSGEASLYDDSDMDPDFKPDSEQSDSSHESVPGSERETSDISPYPVNKDDSAINMDPDFKLDPKESPLEAVPGSESDTSDIYPYPAMLKTKLSVIESSKDDTSVANRTDRQKTDSTNEASISVPLATTYMGGKRVVDKYHACTYCSKLQLRIARHIQSVHKDETAVSELQQLSRQEKAKGLDKLRLDGDYKHNIKVLTDNSGFLILARRPSASNVDGNYSYSDFLPCEYCTGFFLKHELWRHRQTCQFAPSQNKDSGSKYTRAQSGSVLMLQASLPQNKTFNAGFMKFIISTLVLDEISLIIKNDNIILKVGENLFAKHGVKQKQYISQEIRLLGRIVKALRTINGNVNGYLVDFLQPQLFDQIVQAAQSLSGVVIEDNCCSFGTPSVALKCGPVLKKCCVVLKGQALRNSNEIGERNAQRLQHLIEEEWKDKVTSIALRSIKEAKRNEPVLLPSTHDLIKLKEHIESQITRSSTSLKEHHGSSGHFQALSAAVLCRLIMFNRRRSGEASKILVKDYNVRPNWKENLNEEIMQSLQPLEKQLVNRLDMIEIRGKRGRTVPVILTPEIKESLDLLMKCRPLLISEQNQYLFPRLRGTGHIEGHVCMRQFALQAGLENPERIGSTSMRKYIATVVQVLNLNEVEIEWLSNHLGHSVNIHKEFYRNQESAVELGRVAKLLLAVDGGHSLTQGVDEDSLNKWITTNDEDDDLEDDDHEDDDHEDAGEDLDVDNNDLQCEKVTDVQTQNLEPRKLTVKQRVHWTKDEVAAIERQFGMFFRLLKVPGKKDCMNALEKEPVLRNRDWATIKYRVYNTIQRLRKGKT